MKPITIWSDVIETAIPGSGKPRYLMIGLIIFVALLAIASVTLETPLVPVPSIMSTRSDGGPFPDTVEIDESHYSYVRAWLADDPLLQPMIHRALTDGRIDGAEYEAIRTQMLADETNAERAKLVQAAGRR